MELNCRRAILINKMFQKWSLGYILHSNRLDQRLIWSRSEIVSRLAFQLEITGAEPVAIRVVVGYNSFHSSGFSSVGRALDCSGKQTSGSRWFDPGKPEPNFVGEIRQAPISSTRGIGGFFSTQ